MKNFVNENEKNMIADLSKLVAVKSVRNDDVLPFGSENRKALDTALSLMESYGLKTNNIDYYCGYGEVGEGEKLIGILAHLDVVPVSEGWNSDPFCLLEKDGYLYGRGVSDDKGAVIASLYALKYLIDTNYKFKKRVRLITGCAEETGSECIKHYVSKCGHIDMGFTPDGGFPGIYAEKGMVGASLVGHNSKIIDIKGGEASNIVCKKVEAKLPGDSLDLEKLDAFFKKYNIEYKFENDVLTVLGKAAHASTPHLGVNAINYLMCGLKAAGFEDSFVDFYTKNIGLDLNGESLGCKDVEDEITNTTICTGVATKKDGDIVISFDCRFPVKQNVESMLGLFNKMNIDEENEFVVNSTHEPLYFDINSPFIKALDKAYRDVTGDLETKMEAIGGGTYAKAINNCIAFGCEFPGESNNIHDANEKLSIESLKKQVLIYIEAIKNLNEM